MSEEGQHHRRREDNDNERLFFIKRSTWTLMKRMAARSVVMALLTVIGGAVLEHLVDSGRLDKFSLIHQFPELLAMMRASIVIMFAEMSLFWTRLAVSPKLDVQQLAERAQADPMASAVVHAVNTVQWGFRFAVFLYLMGG